NSETWSSIIAAPTSWLSSATMPDVGGSKAAMPIVGILSSGSSSALAELLGAFRLGLKEAGYIEGQNVAIESHWAEGQFDRLRELAADLVQRRVALIFATGVSSALAAKAASSTVPLVFLSQDEPFRRGSSRLCCDARGGGRIRWVFPCAA